jgi:ubiquinone/menaquinone biosynthesis C-methylase UbiE
VLRECRRVLRPGGGRIVVAGMTKKLGEKPLVRIFEWTHRHFPNFLDCRPIYVQRVMEDAGFAVQRSLIKQMWVPVAIVLAVKPKP